MDYSAMKYSISKYLKLSYEEKKIHISTVLDDQFNDFTFGKSKDIPFLIHNKSGLEFVYVPGGEYIKGFSEENQCAAEKISDVVNANYDEMRPVRKETVAPFLITRTPILNKNIDSMSVVNRNGPFYCSYEEATEIANKVAMRLPNENEWEYFARSGSNTLFPFGDELLDEYELKKWMTQDFGNLEEQRANELGIYGLFTGEWTTDHFTNNYSDEADVFDCRTVRGGGAFFWPWQAQEWVWCMSAMRMPSDDLINNICAFRIVYDNI